MHKDTSVVHIHTSTWTQIHCNVNNTFTWTHSRKVSGGENRAFIVYMEDFSHIHAVAKVLYWLMSDARWTLPTSTAVHHKVINQIPWVLSLTVFLSKTASTVTPGNLFTANSNSLTKEPLPMYPHTWNWENLSKPISSSEVATGISSALFPTLDGCDRESVPLSYWFLWLLSWGSSQPPFQPGRRPPWSLNDQNRSRKNMLGIFQKENRPQRENKKPCLQSSK